MFLALFDIIWHIKIDGEWIRANSNEEPKRKKKSGMDDHHSVQIHGDLWNGCLTSIWIRILNTNTSINKEFINEENMRFERLYRIMYWFSKPYFNPRHSYLIFLFNI
jgi:hypothetical protein